MTLYLIIKKEISIFYDKKKEEEIIKVL